MKRQIRNKSFNGVRPVQYPYYDEDKIFPNDERNNLNTSNDNNNNNEDNFNNNERFPPYPNGEYPPSSENTMRRPYGGTAMEGFGRPYLNPENNNINNKINNSMNINTSPIDRNNPNSKYQMPPNTLGFNNGRNVFPNNQNSQMGNYMDNVDNRNQNNLTGENISTGANATGSNFSSSTLKNQILNNRKMKESTFLSFDKDFNVNGIKKKVRGKAK